MGTTRIAQRWRISLIKDVREAFAKNGSEFEEGYVVVFKERDEGIFVEPAK